MNEQRLDSRLVKAASWLASKDPRIVHNLGEFLFNIEAAQFTEALGEYVLGVDVWEGNGDINEQALYDGGVRFLIIRLNSITGGLHMDDNFAAQWLQAESLFLRMAYMVYNPWVNGRTNFDWLVAHLPTGCRRVAIDIEVTRDGYVPSAYAAEVDGLINLCIAAGLLPVIYTGGWFLPILSKWPTGCDYWWGRYPLSMYPPTSQNITWEQLQVLVQALTWSPGPTPGPCNLWQCSGDRFKLPGTNLRTVDINLWHGSLTGLSAYMCQALPPPAPTLEQRVSILEREARLHNWNLG